ncbi:MAG: class I SAM-dependent methyltransferase [Nitrospirota bacterium]
MSADAVQWGSFEISGPRHEYRESLLAGLVTRAVEPGATVLDAGCGGGSLAVALAVRGYRVVGVESSPECVARARRRAAQSGVSGLVSINRGDVTALPVADASVDAVVSGEVLEHVTDDAAAAAEYRRVLRPGGACLVSVPAHPALWDVTDEWAGHVRRYRRGELIALFEGQGFAVDRVRAWGFPTVLFYHRLLFLPWARRSGGLGEASSKTPSTFRRAATALLGAAFRVDGLFSRLPVGWGWLLTARAPKP